MNLQALAHQIAYARLFWFLKFKSESFANHKNLYVTILVLKNTRYILFCFL